MSFSLRITLKLCKGILSLLFFILSLPFYIIYIIWIFLRNIMVKIKLLREFKDIFMVSSVIGYILLSSLLLILNKTTYSNYLPWYSLWSLVTFFLITSISREVRSPEKKEVEGYGFLKAILPFMICMFLYVCIFAGTFYTATYYNHGNFITSENKIAITIWDFLYISSRTFLSMETQFIPYNFVKLLVVIEAFISQVIIFGFVISIFVDLLKRYKKTEKTI